MPPSRGQAFALAASAGALLLALAAVAGFALGWPALTSLGPGLPPMRAHMIVGVALAAGALALRSWPGRSPRVDRLGQALALLLASQGLLLVGEYATGAESWLDDWLIEHLLRGVGVPSLGDPAPQTSLALALLGLAIALLGRRTRWHLSVPELLAIGAAMPALVALLGFSYGIQYLYLDESGRMTTAPASLALLALAAGVVAAQPRGAIVALLSGNSPGAILRRQMLALPLIYTFFLGWTVLAGQQAGLYPPPVGFAIMVLGTSAVAIFHISWLSSTLDRLDRVRQAEAAESQRMAGEIEDLYQRAPCGYHSLDANGRILRINDTELAWLGYTRAEVEGHKTFRELMTPASQEVFDRNFPVFKERGFVKDLEFELIRKDGSTLEVILSATAIRDEAGRYHASRSIMVDVTERNAAQRNLAQAERRFQAERLRQAQEAARREAEVEQMREVAALKDTFLSTLSHEIKTPLSLIVGDAELLLDRYHGDPLAADLLDGAARLTRQLGAIFDYSAAVGGGLPLYRSEVALPEIVANAGEALRPQFEQKGIRLEVAVAAGTPCLDADSRRVFEMVEALLDNACKFTPAGGRVGVDVAPADSGARVTVWDTGRGIADGDLAKVWLPFTQLGGAPADKAAGLGLGLAMVKCLAELHGGRVSAESEPGRGSRFTIWLPAAAG